MPAVPSVAVRRPKDLESPAADAPPPSFMQEVTARMRVTEDETPEAVQMRRHEAYKPIIEALKERGFDEALMRSNSTAFGYEIPGLDYLDYDKIYQLARVQKIGDLKGNREEFDAWHTGRKGEYDKNRAMIEKHGNWYVGLPIDMVASFKPEYGPLLMAGGSSASVGGAMLKEAVINAAFEGADIVRAEGARKTLGNPITGAEAVERLAMAAVGGAALGGIEIAIAKNWDSIKAAPKAVQEKAWAKIVSSSPALQKRLGNAMDWDAIGDADLPDIAEAMIGLENLSPDEMGFIAAIRREAQIEGMNPYIPDGAGIAAHHNELAAAMQRIIDNAPPMVPKKRVAPVAAASGPLPRLRASTAVSSGGVAGDAFAVVKSRIGVVESGGSNKAKNPNSSATGTYQFVSGTWLKLYKSRFGSQGLSDGQIIAKRADSRLQEILMTDLMNANGKALRDGGHAVDAGNLYLAHFAGSAGANKLLRADPNTSARAVLGDAVIKANPFLAKMNAADVINWAHRKMTGKGGAGQSSIGTRQSDIDPEADSRDWVARELAAVDAERARLDAEDDAQPDMGAIVDDALQSPKDFEDSFAASMAEINAEIEAKASRPIEPAARLADAAPVEVLAVLPELRKIVNDRTANTSLSNLGALSRQIGVPESDLRKGLIALAANGELRMRYNKDQKPLFSRLPQDSGPVDMLKFIARKGGIRNDAGHDLRGMFEVKQVRNVASGKGALRQVKQVPVSTTYMVPGAGPMVRDTGRSLDEIGELLHEAGYFDARPTETEVLEAIADSYRSGTKRYARGDEGAASALDYLEEQDMMDMRRDFDAAADERGISLDDEAFDTVARMYADGEYKNVGEAIVDMINREIEADIAAKYYELGDQFDESRIEEFLASAREAGFDIDGGFDRPEVDAGNAAAVGTSGRNAFGQNDQGPIELTPDAYKPFDDPGEGAGVTGQIDSMEHDLRAVLRQAQDQPDNGDMFGGATDVEKRQALERRGEGGLSTDAAQKPVGSDGGLFDPDSWAQAGFRLNEEGDVVNPADLLAEFDAEAAILKTIKDCL